MNSGSLIVGVLAAAWLTHVISCLLKAKYLLLIAGAFVFPVGIIHGIGIWFGVNWQEDEMSYYETKITLFGQLVDVIVDFEKDGSADLIEVCLGEKPLCVDGVFHMD